MPDLDDLHFLAPDVDTAVAIESFGRRRAQLRRRRQVVMGSATLLALVVLGAGSLALISRDQGDERIVVARPPAESSSTTVSGDDVVPVNFEVVAVTEVTEAGEPMGTLRAAVDEASYEELWSRSSSAEPAPSLDLSQVVVVSITIPDDACPPELVRFERDAEVITPIFEEPAGFCIEPLIPKTFVVALDRSPLMPRFTLRLPGDDTYGFDEQLLPVDLAATASAPAAPTLDPAAQEVCPPVATGMRLSGGRLVAGFDTTVGDLGELAGDHDEPDTPAVVCWYKDATFSGALGGPPATTDVRTIYIDGEVVHAGMVDGAIQRP